MPDRGAARPGGAGSAPPGLDRQLAGFVRAFRAAGGQASVAESIDAARAVALLGYADRDALKRALAATLAKSARESELCAEVFDLYFSLPAAATPPQAEAEHQRNGQADGGAPADGAAADGATGDPAIDGLVQLAQAAAAGQPGALAAAIQRAAHEAGVDEIRFQSQTAYLSGQVLERLGAGALAERLAQARAAGPAQADLAEQLLAAQALLQREARAHVARRFEIYGRPATDAFLTEVAVERPLGRMSPADMARMQAAVQRMARRLAQRHGRRRRSLKRGHLDLRHTLRANAGHDGVPVSLVWKTRKRDKPRIVAVCDVSGSVAAHVRFLLMFLYALKGEVADLRCFAFSHRLRDIDPPLEQLPFDDAMELILREVGGGSTDYGQAWVDLEHQHADEELDGRTTLLVLGDGRSNHSDPKLGLFAHLTERVRRVVWLSPEPPGRWGTGDSCLLRYRPFVSHMAYAASAADMELAIDEALAAYS